MASKALVVGAYQRKLEEIAAHPGIELHAVVPPSWKDDWGVTHLERAHLNGYRMVVEPLRQPEVSPHYATRAWAGGLPR
jgi:hypothetical protein